MRFTPAIFASVAAASVYGGDSYDWPSSSSSTPAAPVKASTSSVYGGYGYGTPSKASSVSKKPIVTSKTSSVSKKPTYTTKTVYTTSSSTIYSCAPTVTNCPYNKASPKVVTSVIAVSTTVCPVEEEEYSTSTVNQASSTPVKPVLTGTTSVPYCSAYTETCTVTVTASSTPWAPVKAATSSTPYAPVYPVTASTPVYPVYGSSSYTAWGTGSPVAPSAYQFTGAAVAQKAGAVLAGAGAIAAMLL